MKTHVIQCGPFANESEQQAINSLKTRLIAQHGAGEWLLLTNLAFAAGDHRQADEIDIVAIGPPGVQVIEVKHWTQQWVKRHPDAVAQEADRVTLKARKIGTTLRRTAASLSHVDAAFYITQTAELAGSLDGQRVRGVGFHTVKGWDRAVGLGGPDVLTAQQVVQLAKVLSPKASVATDGSLGRLAGYAKLALQTPIEDRFHRVYRGVHTTRRNAVRLHLYDLSATDLPNAEDRARRECEALRRLQKFDWAPRVYDSFQEAPGYAGEMWFFTIADPHAPTVADRNQDAGWATEARISFARGAVSALADLHGTEFDGQPLLHRNLAPTTILVKHDNTPLLTGFEYARIPTDVTVAVSGAAEAGDTFAPEVREQGRSAADTRSDSYSLCASLKTLFTASDEQKGQDAAAALAAGMEDDPSRRATLEQISDALGQLLGEHPSVPVPPARFWTEDQIVRFRERDYRIIGRLGSGGVGTTFKVVETSHDRRSDLGAYVAKVVNHEVDGERVLSAYRIGRSHIRHSSLSTIYEVAEDWQDNGITALMTWIEGQPLSDLAGVLAIHAEDVGEDSDEALVVSWLRVLCEALDVLHSNGLVHGDVSPRNLIVSGTDIVLTDYDCVTRIGQRRDATGTMMYSSATHADDAPADPADDLFALAASFFHVLFEREPFLHNGNLAKEKGLNWTEVDTAAYPTLAKFFTQATDPDRGRRFTSAADAIAALSPGSPSGAAPDGKPPGDARVVRHDNEVGDWLKSLLRSYPGSRWGNSETRGLDTDFASDTYVETALEKALYEQVTGRDVSLVILCGNAGDGKTALLQHLAGKLGMDEQPTSDTRILDCTLESGVKVRMNLDGSAAWRGKSADELLDGFLAPFMHGRPPADLIHLLAVNDGRLLEWIEHAEEGEETLLTRHLRQLLEGEADEMGVAPSEAPAHIRFIDLNHRSLVGGVSEEEQRITTDFLDRLIDGLYGGDHAGETWAPCETCLAEDRCEVRRAIRRFGPEANAANPEAQHHARQRLYEALQAVHLRGQTHITIRELRAALVYILFGTHYCTEYHAAADPAHPIEPYWQRTFAAESDARQGEVLREFVRFDPALESHPKVDRYLLESLDATAPTLTSARRRAYFETSPDQLAEVAGSQQALELAHSRHIRAFRDLPIRQGAHTDLCRKLCAGISRLEDLPPHALDRPDAVPLRVTPRTPTETAFWVEKPLAAFRLVLALPAESPGLDRLHRYAKLVYAYGDGKTEELALGAGLFDALMELAEGYQLGDIAADDTFTQLAIFVRRLMREDERRLLAWNPMQDDTVYEIDARLADAAPQRIHIRPEPRDA